MRKLYDMIMLMMMMMVLGLMAAVPGQAQTGPVCEHYYITATGRTLLTAKNSSDLSAYTGAQFVYIPDSGVSGISVAIEGTMVTVGVANPIVKIAAVTTTSGQVDMGQATGPFRNWYANVATLTGTGVTVWACWHPNVQVASGGGSGTVTSFSAGNLSPLFTTSVATATTTPALTFSLSNVTANRVYAGPTSGGAAPPSFRVITLASADFVNQGTATTVLHGNAAGNPSFAAVSLTADVSGILPLANGGTNQNTWTAARCVRVNAGGTALEAFSADCSSGTGTVTSITATSPAVVTPTPLTTTGVISLTGPPNITTLTNHGVALGQGASAIAATSVGANNTLLHGNTGADPSFSAVSLTADVSGVLPLANGGTNQSSWTSSRCVHVNAGGTALESTSTDCSAGTGTAANLQIFNVADTGTNWTLPASGQIIKVIACGGGGGGGGGSGAAAGSIRIGGGGGGGGICIERMFRASDISSPVTVTVGAGGIKGTGGSNTVGVDGSVGGTSSFGTYLQAFGGGGGAGHTAGAAGGGGAGCQLAGVSATNGTGVLGGDCFATNTTLGQDKDGLTGAGSTSPGTSGAAGHGSSYGGGSGGSSTSAGATSAVAAGGSSYFSGAGGGAGGGVNAASPGTAQNGLAGGATGPMVTSNTGGGGAAGATASACGSGGEGQAGTAVANSMFPGGTGGGGGSSKAGATACNGGNGGIPGGGGGGGGGGTTTGGDGGTGGAGVVFVWTSF